DMYVPLAVGGDGGAPVVGPVGRDRLLAVPLAVLEAGDEDLEVAVAPALPGDPHGPAGVRGQDGMEVGPRVAADPRDLRPGAVGAAGPRGVAAVVDVVVVLDALAPGEVEDALAVAADRRPPEVEARGGHVEAGAPGLAVEGLEAQLVAVAGGDEFVEVTAQHALVDERLALLELVVDEPDLAVGGAGQGRVVVLGLGAGQADRGVGPHHGELAVEVELRSEER